MQLDRPSWLVSRNPEWDRLERFCSDGEVGARLAIMYGRRRQGKTALLQAVEEATGAFYWQAVQQSSAQNLRSFSIAWSRWRADGSGILFESWPDAVSAMFDQKARSSPVVIIDEFGYLLDAVPEVASLIQAKLTPREQRTGTTRLVLCGSSYTQMRALLTGDAPLRGRASLELVVRPFDYRTAAAYWGLDQHPDAAFQLHALVGGTPGYLPLAGAKPRAGNVERWLVEHVLDPTSPLFREGKILISEDSSLPDRALYWSVLGAIADGHRRRKDLAEAVGRPQTALSFALKVLTESDWIESRQDPFHRDRSTLLLNEPIIRLHRLVIEPEEGRLFRGGAKEVAQDTRQRIARQIFGPHLEWLASEWCMAFASLDTMGGRPRSVGSGVLEERGARHQVDLVAVEPDATGGSRIHAIGEVKAERTPVGVDQLERLDHIATRLGARAAPNVKRIVVGRSGFTAELQRAVARRSDTELVDLDRLYSGT
jgi:uncharacterized protein